MADYYGGCKLYMCMNIGTHVGYLRMELESNQRIPCNAIMPVVCYLSLRPVICSFPSISKVCSIDGISCSLISGGYCKLKTFSINVYMYKRVILYIIESLT